MTPVQDVANTRKPVIHALSTAITANDAVSRLIRLI